MKKRTLEIAGITVSDSSKCFVIAEIGHNHQGKVSLAKEMIKAAADSGASAVKLQKRNNKSLFTQDYYNQIYNSENSFGATYGEHRENLEFNREQYIELQKFSEDLGVVFFATAFDFESADFLAELNVPAYKLASGDLKNIPLIRYVAAIGKPVILSTGGGTLEDVDRAVVELDRSGTPYCIMQCTAGYPPAWDELNLRVISEFRSRYENPVIGFSSHDNGIAMASAGYALGARMIEKHFTTNRTLKGTDHAFSLEPQGLRKMVRDLDRLHIAMGDGQKRQFESEKEPLRKMGKKLVISRAMKTGEVLTANDIAFRSPADGLAPYMVDEFIGKRLVRDVPEEHTLAVGDVG